MEVQHLLEIPFSVHNALIVLHTLDESLLLVVFGLKVLNEAQRSQHYEAYHVVVAAEVAFWRFCLRYIEAVGGIKCKCTSQRHELILVDIVEVFLLNVAAEPARLYHELEHGLKHKRAHTLDNGRFNVIGEVSADMEDIPCACARFLDNGVEIGASCGIGDILLGRDNYGVI